MRSLAIALVLALGIPGCAHKPISNDNLARSAVTVGAAVLITGALVYAEYRSQSTGDVGGPSAAALPPQGAQR
jgi:hypothetical protein